MGMTSSDLLDTSLALLCKESGEIILKKVKIFQKLLREKAIYKGVTLTQLSQEKAIAQQN